jgi:hypothetical protein
MSAGIGEVTVEDLITLNALGHQYIDSSPAAEVHFCVTSDYITSEPSVFQQAKIFDVLKHPRLGRVIEIGKGNAVTDMINRVVFSVTKVKYTKCETYEEALQFLAQNAEELPEFDMETAITTITNKVLVSYTPD